MKKEFEKAEVEIIRFEKEDVIATSGETDTSQGMAGTGDGMGED